MHYLSNARDIVFSTENNLSKGIWTPEHNRRCIDGRITGCGKCVGYCRFSEHPGFLTAKLRQQHNCIKKECYYYISKPKSINTTSFYSKAILL